MGTEKPKRKSRKKSKPTIIGDKPITQPATNIPMTAIRSQAIETGWLEQVHIKGDGDIELTDSWIEFIMLMLGTIYSTNPEIFITRLVDHKVLSDSFEVTTKPVHYPESSEVKYAIYKLTDTPYYLEIHNNSEGIIESIIGLLRTLRINPSDVTVDIKPIERKRVGESISTEPTITSYDDIKQIETTKTLYEIMRASNQAGYGLSEINISAITIFGYKQKAKSTTHAMHLFMIWSLQSYGKPLEQAAFKLSSDTIGLKNKHDIEEIIGGYEVIQLGENYIYTSGDNSSTLRFIYNIAMEVGLSPELIEITYKELKLGGKRNASTAKAAGK